MARGQGDRCWAARSNWIPAITRTAATSLWAAAVPRPHRQRPQQSSTAGSSSQMPALSMRLRQAPFKACASFRNRIATPASRRSRQRLEARGWPRSELWPCHRCSNHSRSRGSARCACSKVPRPSVIRNRWSNFDCPKSVTRVPHLWTGSLAPQPCMHRQPPSTPSPGPAAGLRRPWRRPASAG